MRLCFVLFILFLSTSIFAITPQKYVFQYGLDHWTTDDGLPQNSAVSLSQSYDKYLWIATEEGFVRFDGVKFKVFDKNNIPELETSFAKFIYEDSSEKGSLWVGMMIGKILRYNYLKKTYKFDLLLKNAIIRYPRIDKNGVIWFFVQGGAETGLYCIKNGKVEKINVFEFDKTKQVVLSSDSTDGLWFSYDNTAIYHIKDGVVDRKFYLNEKIYSLFEDSDGKLWVGTSSNGLFFYNESTKTFDKKSEGDLENAMFIYLYEDKDGNIWAATKADGLIRMRDKGRAKIESFDRLPINNVNAMMEDHEGSLWIGAKGRGLYRLKDTKFTPVSGKKGLLTESIFSVLERSNKDILMGTNNNGIFRLSGGDIFPFDVPGVLDRKSALYSMFEDKSGTLWSAVLGKYIAAIGKESVRIIDKTAGLNSSRFSVVFVDSSGSVWIGTYSEGVQRITPDGKITYFRQEDGLGDNYTHSIQESSDKSIWIATRGGLTIFKDGKFKNYTEKNGLSDKIIYSINFDNEKTAWIASEKGITIYRDNKFTPITHLNGLPNFALFHIITDNAGNIWASSNKGIVFIRKTELEAFLRGAIPKIEPKIYGREDGLLSNEMNGGTQYDIIKTSKGLLYFASSIGVAFIDPSKIQENKEKPPVVFEYIRVDEKDVTSQNNNETIFPAGSKKFEFHFTALSFLYPNKVKFKYKLDGFDREWSDLGTQRTAYYTNLKNGHYTFKVIAANNDGIWNAEGASFSFFIEPHFYETWWFYLLCGASILFSGAGIYKLKVRQMKRREEALTQLVEERTIELVEITIELEIKSKALEEASMRDPLTNLRNRRYFYEVVSEELCAILKKQKALINHNDRRNLRLSYSGIFIFDIDHFKMVNDTYGHNAGDIVLQQFSRILAESVRSDDILIRWGGEEFLVFLKETQEGFLSFFAEKIRKKVENYTFILPGGQTIKKTVSIGYIAFPFYPENPDFLTFDQSVGIADFGLYYSKENGRNLSVMVEIGDKTAATDEEKSVMLQSLSSGINAGFLKIRKSVRD